jgi:pyrimidine operon attenuation protein/uracil phosphoribosyltransferase
MNNSLILSHEAIALKLDRIAWQILEEHFGDKKIVLVGLADKGSYIANEIETRITKFSDVEVLCIEIILNKETPLKSEVKLASTKGISNSSIVLVDDVLNSGKTMVAALKEVLNYFPKKVSVAVLANRDHHKFPMQANFVGISLATTVKEHISFKLDEGKMSIWLD